MADVIPGLPGLAMPQLPDFGMGLWIILGILGVASALIVVMYNSRYPQRKFWVEENGVCKWINYRIDGTRILDDNMLSILFNRQKLCEDITMFRRKFFIGVGNIYLAHMVHGVLVPMDISHNEVKVEYDDAGKMKLVKGVAMIMPSEIWTGKQVALRYIENEEFSKAQGKRIEPITASLMMALPLILVLIVFLGGLYLLFDNMIKVQQATALLQEKNAQITYYNTQAMLNITDRSIGNVPAKLPGG